MEAVISPTTYNERENDKMSQVTGAPVNVDMATDQRTMELAELGPAPPFQKSNPNVQYPPFPTLIGEHAILLSKTREGTAMVTNFRFCVCERRSFINVPLLMIGDLEANEAYYWLKVCCKDGASYSCTFATLEDCNACVNLLRQRTRLPREMKDLFAYRFYAMATYKGSFDGGLTVSEAEQVALCNPGGDKNIGVVLVRSSQPMSSFLGLSYFSNHADVSLLEKIVEACHKEREAIEEEHQRQSGRALLDSQAQGIASTADALARENEDGAQGSLVPTDQTSAAGHGASNGAAQPSDIGKLAIVDCRSVATVWGNSLKGGGTEDEVVYKCSIIHLDLANIHAVRDSFVKLRTLCHSYAEGNYFKSLSGCMWLTYISALLRGANIVVDLMQVQRRPVLVHCSDGWDRTSQICSLSELMMDKYYRTMEGFQVLVEREWLHFGHKFAERGGHDLNCSDTNQISPVFVQFLDCVFQLTLQYPAEFQFNEAYLVKLLKHSQACLFGTFLHNSERERKNCSEPTASVWSLLQPTKAQFVNLLYKPSLEILTAKYAEHDVSLWKNVYMAGLSPWRHGSQADFHMESSLMMGSSGEEAGGIARSKSMDDLSKGTGDAGRRNSDPMVTQNQECAASAPTGLPSSGNIHDTSSSSAEILHYPEDSSPSPPRNEKDKERNTKDNSACESPESTGQTVSSSDLNSPVVASKDDETASPEESINLNTTEDVEKPDPANTEEAGADAAEAETSTGNCDADKAQNLRPSSSSVFSGVEVEGEDTSLSTGEDTLCCDNDNAGNDSSPAELPIATTTTVVAGQVTDAAISSHSCPSTLDQALSASSSSSSLVSASASSIPLGRLSQEASCLPSEARLNKDSAVPSREPTSSLPVSPVSCTSTSLSQPSPSLQNEAYSSSLLAERLAEEAQNSPPVAAGRTIVKSPINTSENTTQHSRRASEDIHTAVKLKAGAVLDTARKSNGISAARGYANVGFSPAKSEHQKGSSPTSKHVHHPQHQLSNSVEDTSRPGSAMTESTDTLVDQPLGVDISGSKHSSVGGTKRVSTSRASYTSSSVSPSSSYSSPSLLTASPQRRDSSGSRSHESPDSPQYIQQSRRARAASGASRDLSVSPCSTCKGAWADVGRLRNPSGGGEMVTRRWLGATVATSTSDISDSSIGKVGNRAVALMERGPSMRQHLDVDSLTLFCDERQDLLAEVVAEKDRKILELELRLCQARDIIRANRERQQQQCTSSSAHINGHPGLSDDL
ncbi:myotubularin related protein 4, partial [Plakobranchus ocellatus]